ncbi:hypothetical protein K435DRAFT_875406 [Dendrothele bispora CBS 962.96]|uniref:Uncharacterized protein n=1 Tax=Dendrothele bispora (strain CBS 962.96) TaxID=1314807 RepID=A0A4S8KUE1_DENBC|nr:hypothetical protein K435DRAFT_875406 [Dendrothele bispora CBS 962.96]
MALQQAKLHRPPRFDNFESYRYNSSKALHTSLCEQALIILPACLNWHPKLTKEGSMAVNHTPSYYHDINTTAATTTAFERLFLLTTRTNYTKLMIMHFHDLPVSVLALLFLQMHHTIASSVAFPSLGDLFTSSFSPKIEIRDDTAYDQNPNGSFFIWLPQDEYSGDTFFDVRISSISQYNTGLFILDINRAPWGCVIWTA